MMPYWMATIGDALTAILSVCVCVCGRGRIKPTPPTSNDTTAHGIVIRRDYDVKISDMRWGYDIMLTLNVITRNAMTS